MNERDHERRRRLQEWEPWEHDEPHYRERPRQGRSRADVGFGYGYGREGDVYGRARFDPARSGRGSYGSYGSYGREGGGYGRRGDPYDRESLAYERRSAAYGGHGARRDPFDRDVDRWPGREQDWYAGDESEWGSGGAYEPESELYGFPGSGDFAPYGYSTRERGAFPSRGRGEHDYRSGSEWHPGEPLAGWSASQRLGRFSGRGPKGYRRSRERIMDDVCERLTDHPEIDASGIEVDVQNDVVVLRGSVEDRQQKRLAEDLVESVSGVRDVRNELESERGMLQTLTDAITGRGDEQVGNTTDEPQRATRSGGRG